MKKYILLFILFHLFIFEVFASGSADMQSRALLYRQQRTTWTGAPDSAIFYDVYLIKNRGDVILLDVFMKPDFLESPLLIINKGNSMQIFAHNESAMLRMDGTIYKCVVLVP